MIIILINIPASTDNQDIDGLIRPSLNHGRIKNISIMAQKNTGTHDLQYHGLVTITPDSAAKDVIDKLNGTQLNDKHIVIREYKNREYVADQKALDELNTQHQGDRRHQYSESYLVSKLKL